MRKRPQHYKVEILEDLLSELPDDILVSILHLAYLLRKLEGPMFFQVGGNFVDFRYLS